MSTTASFLQFVSLALPPLLFLFSSNFVAQAQSITLSLSSSPLPVELSGTQEVLGAIRLTAGPGPGSMTTQISTLQIWYQGVSISNAFAGLLTPNPASGVILHPDGMVVTFTGGYNHSAVTAGVFNSTLGSTPVGIVTLSFPGGLTISPGDFIDVNGVRASIAGKNEGDKIECLILSAPGSSHVVNVVSATVAQVVNNSLRITTASLADALIGAGYSQTLAATGGTPPYLWQITAGSLPTPLSLDSLTGLISGGPQTAPGVVLKWNANTEADLAGYKLYQGAASRSYGPATNVGNQTTYTVTGLNAGTYYFAVTAFDTSGNESGFSNEVSKVIVEVPPPPPGSVTTVTFDKAVGGAFSFVVQVTDKAGTKASKNYSINVQGLSIDRGRLDLGEAIVGTSLTRTIMVSNVGTVAQEVVATVSGSPAFAVSPASFRVEAGKVLAVSATLTPTGDSGGFPLIGQVNFLFSGLVRIVTLIGKSKVSVAPPVSVLPASGATVGNTRVRIRGPLLAPFSSLAVGGVALSGPTRIETDDWIGVTGPHNAGTVGLAITRPDGAVVTIPNLYRYRELPKALPAAGDLRISFVSDTPEFRSNLGINNLSAEAGPVTVLLVDNNGLVVARKTVTVPANGMLQVNHILRYLEDADDVTGREGALLLQSSRPIRGWASQIDNASLDPSLQRATSEGASRILVPSSVVSNRFSTALVISNLTDHDAKLRIVAREKFGAAQLTLNDVDIPGQGFLYFEDFYRSHGLDQATGPIEIEAQEGIQLTALARVYSRQRTGGFFPGVAMNSAARVVVIPHVLDTPAFRTNLGVNNLGSKPANVNLALIGTDGLTLGTFSDSVPAGALVQWDNIQRLLLGSAARTDSEGWLRIESDQDIVAWASQIDNASQDPDFLSATRVSSSRLLIPAAVSAGSFRSTLVILNGDAAPNPVILTVRGPEGDVRLVRPVTIPGNGLLRYEDILDSLGLGGTFGPLEIVSSSNRPILAISRVASDQHTGGLLRTEELP